MILQYLTLGAAAFLLAALNTIAIFALWRRVSKAETQVQHYGQKITTATNLMQGRWN
ncbi:MAG: hypothetical protein AAGK02_07235 [Pseudomonadota bacterium]